MTTKTTKPTERATIKLRPVAPGDNIVVEVQGGFVRRPAPAHGLVVETETLDIFLPYEKVKDALGALEATMSLEPKAPGRQLALPTSGGPTKKK